MPEYITDGDNAYVQRFKRTVGPKLWNCSMIVKGIRAVFPIHNNGRVS